MRLKRLEPGNLKDGFLYAASAISSMDIFFIEPYLAIETPQGFRFVPAAFLAIDLSVDGPHQLTPEDRELAEESWWELDLDDIWCLWSERAQVEKALGMRNASDLGREAVHPIVLEAERILMESSSPVGEGSMWLRHSEHWRGSSLDVTYNHDGSVQGATIMLSTRNGFILRSLLRWLGMPKSIIERITNRRNS